MFSKYIFIPALEVGEHDSVSKFLFYSSRDYLLKELLFGEDLKKSSERIP